MPKLFHGQSPCLLFLSASTAGPWQSLVLCVMVESRDILCSGRCVIQWHLCSFLWWETSEIAVQHVYQHEEVVNGSIKRWSSDQGWDIRKMLKNRAPCHNHSYLLVGGKWIPSMNNRLSLIFLGELRPPILQLISRFLILLIYSCIFFWERQEYYSTLYVSSSVQWRTAKCWAVLESQKNVNEGKCHKVCYKSFSQVSADTTTKSSRQAEFQFWFIKFMWFFFSFSECKPSDHWCRIICK